MASLTCLNERRLPLCLDAVEWCPIEGLRSLLACAAYQLDDAEPTANRSTQFRRGCLHIFELLSSELVQTSTKEAAGVLDCKWSRHRIWGRVCLAAVDATGQLTIYQLDESSKSLVELYNIDLSSEPGLLLLSLDWSNVLSQGEGPSRIVVSDSNGAFHVIEISSSGVFSVLTARRHSFEAWVAAFNYFDTNVVYSGGDDSLLQAHDLRANVPIMTSKEHTAGVTGIQFNWQKEHAFVTGSYDERLLFWDCRAMKRPLSELKAPGGIWRIKHDPVDCSFLALPAMYGGSAVVDGRGEPAIAATYNRHESINYGIDWCWNEADQPDCHLLAVCSFYDKLLSLAAFHRL